MRTYLAAAICCAALYAPALPEPVKAVAKENAGIERKEEEKIYVVDLDKLQGKNLRLILLALPEFLKTGLKLETQRVIVVRVNGKPAVLFEPEVSTPWTSGL